MESYSIVRKDYTEHKEIEDFLSTKINIIEEILAFGIQHQRCQPDVTEAENNGKHSFAINLLTFYLAEMIRTWGGKKKNGYIHSVVPFLGDENIFWVLLEKLDGCNTETIRIYKN